MSLLLAFCFEPHLFRRNGSSHAYFSSKGIRLWIYKKCFFTVAATNPSVYLMNI